MVATKASHTHARVTEGSYKEDVGQAWSLCMVHTLLPAHLEMSATKFSFSTLSKLYMGNGFLHFCNFKLYVTFRATYSCSFVCFLSNLINSFLFNKKKK